MRALAVAALLALAGLAVTGSRAAFTDTASGGLSLAAGPTFAPTPLTAPAITSNGTVLSVSTPGTWRSNLSVTRTYAWQVCTSLLTSSCTDLGLTGSTLSFIGLGSFFRVAETASNSYGPSSPAFSAVLAT